MTPTDDEQPTDAPTTPETATSATEAPATAQRPRRVLLFGVIAVIAIALDQITKALVAAKLPPPQINRILGGVIYLDQERNSGAAFSLGTGFTVILTVVALAVVAVILRFASRMRSVGWAIALGLILGGAVGNLSDRIFRSPGVFRGYVVDWISLFGPDAKYYPVFNLADSAIVVGAILAALMSVLGIDLSGRRSRQNNDKTEKTPNG